VPPKRWPSLSRDKAGDAPTDEPVIVHRQDSDDSGVAAHDGGFLGLAANAPSGQKRLSLVAQTAPFKNPLRKVMDPAQPERETRTMR